MAFRLLWPAVVALSLAAVVPIHGHAGGVPDWLGGAADVERRDDACGVYDWFFEQADRQTEGHASRDELASQRVVNIVNKLVDHHRSNPADRYGAEVRYLVIGDEGPFHFAFEIDRDELAYNLDKECERVGQSSGQRHRGDAAWVARPSTGTRFSRAGTMRNWGGMRTTPRRP